MIQGSKGHKSLPFLIGWITRNAKEHTMKPEPDLKLTQLDYLTGDHHLQMMKAALPYMSVAQQKMISLFVKAGELNRTIHLFEDEEVASMGICSLEEQSSTPLDMLNAMKPFADAKEQDFIDLISNFIQGSRLYRSYQETAEPEGKASASGGFQFSLDQLKNFLPPEQQSRMDTMQMMMQAMQQIT